MFKERLLIGQYYPQNSPLHSLDARTKIIVTLLYMIALFVADDWYGWGALTLLAIGCVALSRIPVQAIWRGLKIIVVICLLTMILNLFLQPGEALISIGPLTISERGITFGLAMGLRIFLLVMFASLMTLTTKPIELTDGLEQLLTPLGKIKVPAHEIAMMMSIALRFIPTILDEFERIALAQRARGAKISEGNIFARIKAFVPLLIPLFISSFRRAEDLADAMEARCYQGGEGRTKWHKSHWQLRDTLTLCFFFLVLAGAIVLRSI